MRPWHTIGYVDSLFDYDEEIGEAIGLIRSEHPATPIIVVAHSTGGLVAALWAYRHPGAIDGLVLNSAWLDMHTMGSLRPAVQPVIEWIASADPKWTVPGGTGRSLYVDSLRGGWASSGFELPSHLRDHADDPAVTGWNFALEWKRPFSYPIAAKWLDTVMHGHDMIRQEVFLNCPVLCLISSSSYREDEWSPRVFSSDVVLDTEIIVDRCAHLGSHITIARFPGKHDLFLSDPQVREQAFDALEKWLDVALTRRAPQ